MADNRTRTRTRIAALLCTVLLALGPTAFAQDAIERQMTPEQFKAAGLDKLDAQELARLNAWLNRTLDTATAKAATAAKKKVEDDNRGFLNFGSAEPVKGRLVGDFRGFGQGREYTLDNGSVWKQVDGATLAGVRLSSPEVTITPGRVGKGWFMGIKGYNTRAKVERVR